MALATCTITQGAGSGFGGAGRRPGLQHMDFEGTAVISANPDTYAAGGILIVWGNKAGTTKPPIPGTTRFVGISGYTFEYNDATGKLIVRQDLTANPSAEIPVAAIPAALSGDTIKVTARFPKLG